MVNIKRMVTMANITKRTTKTGSSYLIRVFVDQNLSLIHIYATACAEICTC